jgi:type IV pilus assembly protein PilM
VARAVLSAGAVTPSLKPGNIADRVAVAAAIRKTLEDVGAKPHSRDADLTLVIPDAAVRVLLLDFDSLPNKLSEALPIVRFRLKKMLPFDADDAMVTYQVMSTSRGGVRVLAVAIPPDVLREYETAAREAGFEPGAVLPSTLACVAAMDEGDGAALLINAHPTGVTTAIVRSGILLLHRSVDLQASTAGVPANLPPALFEPGGQTLPLVDVHETAGEWAAQQPLPEHGRTPYGEPAPVAQSPYALPTVDDDLRSELHNALLAAPVVVASTSMREFAEEVAHDPELAAQYSSPPPPHEPPTWDIAAGSSPDEFSAEIAQAVSVAAAYYEDTLAAAPTRILCAGPLGADHLQNILASNGMAQADGLRVRELVDPAAVLSDAVTASVPRGWLAGVLGALRG